jgi:D-alanyl-D-alanine carboxypeptidase/D-alanyl-D-alanine-endopeptidase (penicillin-binding protein 4)
MGKVVRAEPGSRSQARDVIVNRIVPLVLMFCACAPRPTERPQPRRPVFTAVADSLIHVSELRTALWGIEIFDPARNQSLFSHNAARHFIPASNAKLIVTSAALATLGPDYRFRTDILVTGQNDDGDPERVVVVGRGDPTWSSRFHATHTMVLEQLADSLWLQGIRGITRELVIDASFFGAERVNGTWEVGDLPYGVAAPSGAFVIAEGTVDLEIIPGGEPGDPATARALGPQHVFPVRSAVLTDTAQAQIRLSVDYQAWPDSIVVTGHVPAGRPDTLTVAAPDANRFAAATFADALKRKGILVPAVRIVYDSTEAAELRSRANRAVTTWLSEPMTAIVAGVLQPSQNWMAEQLMRALGGLQLGRGTWSAGLEAERNFLVHTVGLDSTSFFLRDASGLSAQNVISPQALVQLLEYDRRASWSAHYRAALPTPGLPNSTLANRLRGLEGKLFAKTGTITNVTTLSGYITTRSGRELLFAIMTNASGQPSSRVRRGIDRLVTALAEERDWE